MLQSGITAPNLSTPPSFEIRVPVSEVQTGSSLVRIPLNVNQFYDMLIVGDVLIIHAGTNMRGGGELGLRRIFFQSSGSHPDAEVLSQGVVTVGGAEYAVFLEKDQYNSRVKSL